MFSFLALKLKSEFTERVLPFLINFFRQNTLLLSATSFYNKSGTLIKLDNIDQKKVNKLTGSVINSLFSYTEPLWKNTFLVLNYRLTLNQNDAERNTYNKNSGGKYENLNDTLSNHFIFNTTSHLGSFNIRYNVKKFNFAIGTGLGTARYNMNDIRKNTNREEVFTNFVPAIAFNFTPKQQRQITFNYTGRTQNPTLQQIQPIIDNIDPLNITIGNPTLKQAFSHNFNFRASDYKVLKNRNISISANYSTTEDAISNASRVDSLGRRINQAINVSGNYNTSLNFNYGFNIISSLNVGFSIGPSKSRYASEINGVNNLTHNTDMNYRINANFWSDKWISFYFGIGAANNSSTSSIRPEVVTSYWSYSTYSNFQFKFKKQKLYIDLNLNANVYQKTEQFANQLDVYIFNPSIRKVISKDDNWEIKLNVNDLFNQNIGINRNISSNFISETTNQTIQRYFLFSVIYNFSKNGKPANMGF